MGVLEGSEGPVKGLRRRCLLGLLILVPGRHSQGRGRHMEEDEETQRSGRVT